MIVMKYGNLVQIYEGFMYEIKPNIDEFVRNPDFAQIQACDDMDIFWYCEGVMPVTRLNWITKVLRDLDPKLSERASIVKVALCSGLSSWRHASRMR